MALGITPVQVKRDLGLSDYQYKEYSQLPQVVEYCNKYRETLAKEDGDKIRTWQMDATEKVYQSICRMADKDKLSENFMKDFMHVMNKIKGIEKIEAVAEEKSGSGSLMKLTEKTTRKLTGLKDKEQQMLPSVSVIPSIPQKAKPLWSEGDFESAEETIEKSVEYKEGDDEDSDGD